MICGTSVKIPLPAEGLVGVGLLDCRTTDWGKKQGVGLLAVGLKNVGLVSNPRLLNSAYGRARRRGRRVAVAFF